MAYTISKFVIVSGISILVEISYYFIYIYFSVDSKIFWFSFIFLIFNFFLSCSLTKTLKFYIKYSCNNKILLISLCFIILV